MGMLLEQYRANDCASDRADGVYSVVVHPVEPSMRLGGGTANVHEAFRWLVALLAPLPPLDRRACQRIDKHSGYSTSNCCFRGCGIPPNE